MSKSVKRKQTQTNGTTGAAPSGAVERRRYEEKLPCRIETEEHAKLSDELAATVREREEAEEERREAMAGFRERISGISDRQKKLAQCVEQHTVQRTVEVVEYLLPNNEMQTVRVDTGEVLESRAAEKDDLQEGLPLDREPDDDGFDVESEDDILTSAQADALAEERP